MKPTTDTASTVMLGLWVDSDYAAVTGALRTDERLDGAYGPRVEAYWTGSVPIESHIYAAGADYDPTQVGIAWGLALRPDVLAVTGRPWPALRQALEAASIIGARHVIILTNDKQMARALSPPFRAPQPTERKRVYFAKNDFVEVGWGGDADQWAVLGILGGQWGGRFSVQVVEDLPGAKGLWQQQQQ